MPEGLISDHRKIDELVVFELDRQKRKKILTYGERLTVYITQNISDMT